jgi:hypothetical protein
MKNRTVLQLFPGLILSILILTGCADLPILPIFPEPTQVPSGTQLFADDFSKVPGGWGVAESPSAAVSYERGGLRILVSQPYTYAWSVAGKRFNDTHLEVTVTRLDGPANNLIGLVCRYQERSLFYLMFISSDGYYGIAKYSGESYQLIGADQLQFTSVVNPQNNRFSIQADCTGNQLRLYVDDQLLMQAQDDELTTGDVGVFAGAYDRPGVDIVFDDFLVSEP